jgi:hypothetical protein
LSASVWILVAEKEARPVRFELTTSGFEGRREIVDPACLRGLAGITWFDSALAAYRCLPVRVGEKARVSANTFVVDDSRRIEPPPDRDC